MIKGWDQGFASMRKGEKAILRCRSDYAYGSQSQGKIPANSTLNFDVELLRLEFYNILQNVNRITELLSY